MPATFDPARPIVVIAGKENYPVLTVERIRQAGVPVRLLAFRNETRPDLYNSFPEDERAIVKVGQLGHMLKALKRFEPGSALMAGQITPGRLFQEIHPDVKAIAILATLKERNAETIFGALAREIEALGIHLVDARAFLDDQLVEPGPMTLRKFPIDMEGLDYGVRIAREIARLDVGQGIVAARGTTLAVEAFEGTDAMLRRSGQFKAKEACFFKVQKPGQDTRFDVPVFGLKTLEAMRESGLRAAALEAKKVILLNKADVLREAEKIGVALFGF